MLQGKKRVCNNYFCLCIKKAPFLRKRENQGEERDVLMRYHRMSIRFLLVLFIAITIRAGASGQKFIVWGDSQFHHPETFERIVEETELLKPAFVVHVGDMIHGYTYDQEVARREWKRFKKQIEPLSAPFYSTPGNHDVTTPETEPVYGEVWGKNR